MSSLTPSTLRSSVPDNYGLLWTDTRPYRPEWTGDARSSGVAELFAQALGRVHRHVGSGEEILGRHLTVLVRLGEADADRERQVLPRREGDERLTPSRCPALRRRVGGRRRKHRELVATDARDDIGRPKCLAKH